MLPRGAPKKDVVEMKTRRKTLDSSLCGTWEGK